MSYISVLHQTTTPLDVVVAAQLLSYISVLHQTTTDTLCGLYDNGCLISLFYIKPQQPLQRAFIFLVVLYLCSTSNHNESVVSMFDQPLSYISVLHQTTTLKSTKIHTFRLSYISVLHQTTTGHSFVNLLTRCLISLFYIKPQLSAGRLLIVMGCLISLFYIKPQRRSTNTTYTLCCLISLFYIKPQPEVSHKCRSLCCLISLFYIKPQRRHRAALSCRVVLYLCSTSNHNSCCRSPSRPSVVLYLCSTSNHNHSHEHFSKCELSYISVLHQTTTGCSTTWTVSCCLISLFYIKPQLRSFISIEVKVVLYLCSTSNHNDC